MTVCDLCGSSENVFRYGIEVKSPNAGNFYRNGEYCKRCRKRICDAIVAAIVPLPKSARKTTKGGDAK